MWFRLARDYKTRKGEIHFDSWGTVGVKKGAPIVVSPRLRVSEKGKVSVSVEFIFSSGGLDDLKLSDLVLPKHCVKNEWDTIFCPFTKTFFHVSSHDQHLMAQIKYCPKCGREVLILPRYPIEETGQYEIKRKNYRGNGAIRD